MAIFIHKIHCPTLQTLIGLQGDNSVAALQAGHSTSTEDRLYGVSTRYLGKLPEHLVESYANASAEWQVLMKVPEGGKHFSFYDFGDRSLWEASLSEDKSPILIKAKRE